eukprot:scaffold1247_cov251-Pinguiococcus_pyrenoidosus.AAC.9
MKRTRTSANGNEETRKGSPRFGWSPCKRLGLLLVGKFIRYLAAKETERQKAAQRQREKLLHPEKYRPMRPGRDAAIEGGR